MRRALAVTALVLAAGRPAPVGAHGEDLGFDVRVDGAAQGLEVTSDAERRLVLSAPGRELVVVGETGEPFIRVLPEGSVEQNDGTPSAWRAIGTTGSVALEMPEAVDHEPQAVAVLVDGAAADIVVTTTHPPEEGGAPGWLPPLVAGAAGSAAAGGVWVLSGRRRRPRTHPLPAPPPAAAGASGAAGELGEVEPHPA